MKGLRFLLLTLSALAAFMVYMIMTSFDPARITFQFRTLLYASIFVAVSGTISLIWISIASVMLNRLHEPVQLLPIIRQASLIGIVVVALLLLQALRSLLWWDALLIVIAAILFEMFFRVRIPIHTEKI